MLVYKMVKKIKDSKFLKALTGDAWSSEAKKISDRIVELEKMLKG